VVIDRNCWKKNSGGFFEGEIDTSPESQHFKLKGIIFKRRRFLYFLEKRSFSKENAYFLKTLGHSRAKTFMPKTPLGINPPLQISNFYQRFV